MNMLSFFDMADNYEDRKVGRWESADGQRMVSTCRVTDAAQPYETAVAHEDYNDGKMVIVQMYDTRREAEKGHEKWQQLTENDQLPNPLVDTGSAGIALLTDVFSSEDLVEWRTHYRKASTN